MTELLTHTPTPTHTQSIIPWKHNQFLIPAPPLAPRSWGKGGKLVWKFQASNQRLGLSGDQPHREAIEGHLVRTSDAPVTQDILRGLRALC